MVNIGCESETRPNCFGKFVSSEAGSDCDNVPDSGPCARGGGQEQAVQVDLVFRVLFMPGFDMTKEFSKFIEE